MIQKIVKILKKVLLNNLIRAFGLFIPVNKKIWLLSGNDGGGSSFAANCWELAKYVKNLKNDIQVIVVTDSIKVESLAKDFGIRTVKPNTLMAATYACISSVYCVETDLHNEIPNYNPWKGLKVNLWHGVPLKKIYHSSSKLRDYLESQKLVTLIRNILFGQFKTKNYDIVLYTSDHFEKIMREAFLNQNVVLTGQPRNDLFYQNGDVSSVLINEIKSMYGDDVRIVSYLPTFRDSSGSDKNYFIFRDNNDAKDFLNEKNVVIIQKNHSSVLSENIYEDRLIYLSEGINTQELLNASDILITDYSSVFIDYLHLSRPIIFYPYDLDSYLSKDREMYFEYMDSNITPGPKFFNEKELLEGIFSKDDFCDIRNKVRSSGFYDKYYDGKSSMRLYNAILERIDR